MAQMNQRMKEIFEKQEAIVLATATKDGVPNVVPVSVKKVIDDETVLISDQFLNKTLKNLKANPQVAITIWGKRKDGKGYEGYQIKGTVAIETSGQRFEETAKWVEQMSKALKLPFKSKGAVIVKIAEIYSVSPGPDAGKKVA